MTPRGADPVAARESVVEAVISTERVVEVRPIHAGTLWKSLAGSSSSVESHRARRLSWLAFDPIDSLHSCGTLNVHLDNTYIQLNARERLLCHLGGSAHRRRCGAQVCLQEAGRSLPFDLHATLTHADLHWPVLTGLGTEMAPR